MNSIHKSKKIQSLESLKDISSFLKKEGKKIVHAHGVFDLFHIGHKKHLEVGKKRGDVLIVTITADKYVNKGPGRPIFNENLRAEFLASLQMVDYVAISPAASAEVVIEVIKPHFYIKGSDYSNEYEDITGKIRVERELVYKNGGELIITNEQTFSSSNLSNRYVDLYPEEAKHYLESIRSTIRYSLIKKELEAAKNLRCLIIGDTILDEYIYVDPLGKPSKENIISTKVLDRELFCGGVVATASILSSICPNTSLVTLLGSRSDSENIVKSNLPASAVMIPFYREEGVTTKKTRFVEKDSTRKLFEVAEISDAPLSFSETQPILDWLNSHIEAFDLVLVNDFGHGFISREMIKILTGKSKFLAVNAQTNSANRGFNLISKYSRADFVCIDEQEARLDAADRYSDISDVVIFNLKKKIDCKNFLVTQGRKGCLIVNQDNTLHRIPAFTNEPIDTLGAGDAFFAIASGYLATTSDTFTAGFLGNLVAAMKVRSVGHRDKINKINILKYIDCILK